MPYITKQDQKKYDKHIDEIVTQLNLEGVTASYPAGHLNYIITKIVNDTVKRQGLRYQILNSVVGSLECCKMELYRRVAAPYEDEKILQNGDVYTIVEE